MKIIKFILLTTLLSIANLAFAKPLTLVLDWFPNPDHAPLFVAKEYGFFKKQGLHVNIIGPADPADPPKLVAAGKADLALTYQPQLLLAVYQGLPLVRIATLVGTPLNCLVTLKKGPIHSLKDLKGKKIGYSMGSVDSIMISTMLKSVGLTTKDVELINVHYDLTQALLAHKIDAFTGAMRNFELTQMKMAGQEGKCFYPEEHGFPDYDELVIVANKNHLSDPRLPKFVRALTQATQYLVNHPNATWQTFAKAHPALNNPLNKAVWMNTISRFSLRPAALDKSRYNHLAQFMVKQHMIKTAPSLKKYAVEIAY